MNAGVAIPDYTSLQKRAAKLGVSLDVREAKGPIDVVVDSTGLKPFHKVDAAATASGRCVNTAPASVGRGGRST